MLADDADCVRTAMMLLQSADYIASVSSVPERVGCVFTYLEHMPALSAYCIRATVAECSGLRAGGDADLLW